MSGCEEEWPLLLFCGALAAGTGAWCGHHPRQYPGAGTRRISVPAATLLACGHTLLEGEGRCWSTASSSSRTSPAQIMLLLRPRSGSQRASASRRKCIMSVKCEDIASASGSALRLLIAEGMGGCTAKKRNDGFLLFFLNPFAQASRDQYQIRHRAGQALGLTLWLSLSSILI